MAMTLRVFGGCVAILALLFGASEDWSVAAEPQGVGAQPQVGRPAVTYRGGLITPPLPKPRFTLTDTSGTPVDFWSATQGYVTLLFFGYTHCLNECPLHMANIAKSLQEVPSEVRAQIKVVFVTTDPARDSASVLRAWLNHFDRHFIGLTGSDAAIEAAQGAAHIPPASKVVSTTNEDYQVGHASFVLAYTKDNLAHVIYPGGVTPMDWAHDLPRLVAEIWSDR
jgi:protein SCO1/2